MDAVEWVELPNTFGLSQYADGGLMASKPYIASGKYIARQSPLCSSCRYRPDERSGAQACPFTTLYWDFLLRHEARFAQHPRLALQVRGLARVPAEERARSAPRRKGCARATERPTAGPILLHRRGRPGYAAQVPATTRYRHGRQHLGP